MNAVQLFRDALAGWDLTPNLRGPGEDVDLPDPTSDPEAPATVATWSLEYPGVETAVGPVREGQITFGGTQETRCDLVLGLWVQSGPEAGVFLDDLRASARTFCAGIAVGENLSQFTGGSDPARLAGWYGSSDLLRVPFRIFEERG